MEKALSPHSLSLSPSRDRLAAVGKLAEPVTVAAVAAAAAAAGAVTPQTPCPRAQPTHRCQVPAPGPVVGPAVILKRMTSCSSLAKWLLTPRGKAKGEAGGLD